MTFAPVREANRLRQLTEPQPTLEVDDLKRLPEVHNGSSPTSPPGTGEQPPAAPTNTTKEAGAISPDQTPASH